MANSLPPTSTTGTEPVDQFEAIIIGAGISGLYQLYRLRQLGLSVRVYEAGSGVGGQALKEKWADGPRTYLGIQSVGFPNLFTLVGPHNGATFCNIPRCSEQNVEWVTECIRYMRAHNHERIEAKPDAEDAWTEHVADTIANSLLLQADSWFMGANTPGKKRTFLMYAGGSPTYRKKCDEVAAKNYEGFLLQ